MLTDRQRKFVELDKKKAELKEFAEQYSAAVSELVAEMGLNGAFQDGEGTVYQTAECDGKFVYFDKFEIKRTRREGERAGSLSLKAAKELGFNIKE
jgi:hypothetical protein